MARYKRYNYDQLKLLPISFSCQILPGTFEYTLSHIIDHEVNLSVFDARFNNDDTGVSVQPAVGYRRTGVRPHCQRDGLTAL